MPKDSITQSEVQDLVDSTWISVLNSIEVGPRDSLVNRIDHEYTVTSIEIPEYARYVTHTDRNGSVATFAIEDADRVPEALFTLNLEQQAFSNASSERTIERVVARFFRMYGIMNIDLHVVKRPIKSQGDVLLSVAVINQAKIVRKG